MSERFLNSHQIEVVERVLDGRPEPVVLLAPPGSGIGAVIAAICTRAIAEGPRERVLIVTRSRLRAQELQQRLAESSPTVDATLVTGDSFRLFLASGLPGAGVILVTAQLLTRSDIAPAIGANPWAVVISDAVHGGALTRSVLEKIKTTRGKLFIHDWPEKYPLSEHDRLISWYDLPRHELGLHPDREIELWEYNRSPEELEALKEFMRIIDESLPASTPPGIRQNLVAAATSSPLAFEQVLMRAVRNSERRQVDEDLDDAQTENESEWRPHPAAVSALLALVDNIGADKKVGYVIDALRTRKEMHPRIVVFCRMVSTTAYLEEVLSEAEDLQDRPILRVDASTMYGETSARLAQFHAMPCVLITTEGVGTELNLADADLAIMYDGATTERQIQRVWGAIDRPGRTTPPKLVVLAAGERTRLPPESYLLPDSR